MDQEKILNQLCSSAKLDRDRGVQSLSTYATTADESNIHHLVERFLTLLSDNKSKWEFRHGGLSGCKVLLIHSTGVVQNELTQKFQSSALTMLDDSEFRVRIAAGIY